MNYNELIESWKYEEMFRFDISLLLSKGLNQGTTDFLSTVGLPLSAAPFLSFASSEAEKRLESIYSIYESGESEHQNLLCIGTDGAGDPICINLRNDCEIVALNHEEDFKPSFMNSSVVELFRFLTIFKGFGEEINSINGEDAFLCSDFTDGQFAALKNAMQEIDKKALERNFFWDQELKNLLANREYYQNQK